jgi:dephospho-CoA kinase
MRLSFDLGELAVFGLTGGIASGKSTVAARLVTRGVPVLDADAFAREVVLPGSPGLAEIRATFGDAILAADGTLDRPALARVVFSDEVSRKKLNAITHPRIAALTAERSAELAARGEPLACYEAALIVENGLADAFRPLVAVTAPEDLRVSRAVERDGSTPEAARSRIAAQVSVAEMTRAADFVIENAGDLESLRRATDATLARVCERTGVPAARYGL